MKHLRYFLMFYNILYQKFANPNLRSKPVIDGDKRTLMVASYYSVNFQIPRTLLQACLVFMLGKVVIVSSISHITVLAQLPTDATGAYTYGLGYIFSTLSFL